MAEPARRIATYDDVLAAPAHQVAELIGGELFLSPRPSLPHATIASALSDELGPPFKRGRGGPGGWIILFEPELHLGRDVLVPDLAGWRRERLPAVAQEPHTTLAPDWACEVLSPGTARLDRAGKLPRYAAAGVGHCWLVDPLARTLEVFRLEGGRWVLLGTHADQERVRAEPFDALELELGVLWQDLAPPPAR